MKTQKCYKCSQDLDLTSEFWHKNKARPNGFATMCKSCSAESRRSDKFKLKLEGFKACTSCSVVLPNEDYHSHGDGALRSECKPCRAKREKAVRLRNKASGDIMYTVRELLYSARRRSKKYGYKFDLKLEDIETPELCPVYGLKLQYNETTSRDLSASLDRIVPNKGYVKGNVVIISGIANRHKSDMTEYQLKQVLGYVQSH